MADSPSELLAEISAQLGDLPERLAAQLATLAEPGGANPSEPFEGLHQTETEQGDDGTGRALDRMAQSMDALADRLSALENRGTAAVAAQMPAEAPELTPEPPPAETSPEVRERAEVFSEDEYERASWGLREAYEEKEAELPDLAATFREEPAEPMPDLGHAVAGAAAEPMPDLGHAVAGAAQEPEPPEHEPPAAGGVLTEPTSPVRPAGTAGLFPPEEEGPAGSLAATGPPDFSPSGMIAAHRETLPEGEDVPGGNDTLDAILRVLEEIRDGLRQPAEAPEQRGFASLIDPDQQHFAGGNAPSMPYGNRNGTVHGFGMDHGSRGSEEPVGRSNFWRTEIQRGR